MTLDLVTAVNALVRDAVRTAMGMAAGTVRPANQRLGVGQHGEEFATVNVTGVTALAVPSKDYIDDPTVGSEDVVERITTPISFSVSVNFFRSPDVDGAGLAQFGCNAFSRAIRLPELLQSSASVELLRSYGLGLGRISQARNLTSMIEGGWESRGQIDLDFLVINRETLLLASYAKTVTVAGKAIMDGSTTRTFTATTTAEET